METGIYMKDGNEIYVYQILYHLGKAYYKARSRVKTKWTRESYVMTIEELKECAFVSK